MGIFKKIQSGFVLRVCEDSTLDCIKNANECIDIAIDTTLKNSKDFRKISIEKYKELRKYKNEIICDIDFNNYIVDNIKKYYDENNFEYELIEHYSQCAEIMEVYNSYTIIYIDK